MVRPTDTEIAAFKGDWGKAYHSPGPVAPGEFQSPRRPSTHLAAEGDVYWEVDGEPSLREATQDQPLR